MRVFAALSLMLCAALPLPAATPDLAAALQMVRAEEAARVAAFEQAAKSVVCIFGDNTSAGGGSGVIIDPRGFGLTNFHVVANFLETRKGMGGLSDGNLYPLTVLGIDPGGDVAFFKLDGREAFDFAPLGNTDESALGQSVAAMGNPFIVAEDYRPTITLGIISGLHRYQEGAGEGNLLEYADCIQVSSSINPGNSGGPLFDMQGRVIGINGRGSFEERGRVNVGIGYAITINQIRRFMPGLRAGLLVEHGTLGATVQSVGNEAIFNQVQESAPAERAGVQLGDALLAVDTTPIRTANDFNNVIATLPADWPVSLAIRRRGQAQTLTARLERLPAKIDRPWVPDAAVGHAEVRRLFEAFGAQLTPKPVPPVQWSAELRGGARDSATAELAGEIVCNATTQPAAESDAAREFAAIARPLLSVPAASFEWRPLGADLIDGRLAAVVEHRPDAGPRLRWYFDWETGALLQACVGTAENPCAVTWTPARSTDQPHAWPMQWQRMPHEATPESAELFVLTSLIPRQWDPAPPEGAAP